jgi:Ca-activated chloride channel family protein
MTHVALGALIGAMLGLAGCADDPRPVATGGATRSAPAATAGAAPVHPPPAPSLRVVPGQQHFLAAPMIAQTPNTAPASDRFPDARAAPVQVVAEQSVSTFAADVDTASYAVARRFLREGRKPMPATIRVEEMVNYFAYEPPSRPAPGSTGIGLDAVLVPDPTRAGDHLLHLTLSTARPVAGERPPLNLVLLVDVSGSMAPDDRLPLLRRAFAGFVDQLGPRDRIAIVSYANGVATRLEPTRGDDRGAILAAIDGLVAGGGTAGADGIQRAYALAERHFSLEAVNRIVLATDGDFNVGITDPNALEAYVAGKRRTGVYLTVMGVGLGNLNDRLIQRLTQAGNGTAVYVDNALEARRVLIDEAAATFLPVADDVKIQVEFNPRRVAEYRLLGYETRALARQDFTDDRKDAGEIGQGHTVTAIYRVTPTDGQRRVPPLRYTSERTGQVPADSSSEEWGILRVRHKAPGGSTSRLTERPITDRDRVSALDAAHVDQRFQAAVAAFALKLRGDGEAIEIRWDDIHQLADGARGRDPGGWRAEFTQLVRLAQSLDGAIGR